MKHMTLMAILLALLGCSRSEPPLSTASVPNGTGSGLPASAPNGADGGVVLSGSDRDVLSNGIYTAHLERALLDLEDETGVRPGELVYRFHVVIGNAGPGPLRFDTIHVKVKGGGKDHSNTQQRRQEGEEKPLEITLTSKQGTRSVATTPEASVSVPEHLVVELTLNGQSVGSPLTFTLSAENLQKGKRLLAAEKASGGSLVRSRAMAYEGLAPKAALEKAQARAQAWHPNASLRLVVGNKWSTFGNPSTQEVTAIEVSEWRYTYVADGKARSFVVSKTGVQELDDPNALPVVNPLPPLKDWKVDVAEAVKIAANRGVKIRIGPTLRMFPVRGTPTPLWVMPGAPGLLIDALTGKVVSEKDVDAGSKE
jgi:hypothetical protein